MTNKFKSGIKIMSVKEVTPELIEKAGANFQSPNVSSKKDKSQSSGVFGHASSSDSGADLLDKSEGEE
jgi:hypothetical protein